VCPSTLCSPAQVPLYAEWDRPSLLPFLRRAEHDRLQEVRKSYPVGEIQRLYCRVWIAGHASLSWTRSSMGAPRASASARAFGGALMTERQDCAVRPVKALAECSRRRYWEEQAFLLGRMGHFRGAMAVTLEEMGDVAGGRGVRKGRGG